MSSYRLHALCSFTAKAAKTGWFHIPLVCYMNQQDWACVSLHVLCELQYTVIIGRAQVLGGGGGDRLY